MGSRPVCGANSIYFTDYPVSIQVIRFLFFVLDQRAEPIERRLGFTPGRFPILTSRCRLKNMKFSKAAKNLYKQSASASRQEENRDYCIYLLLQVCTGHPFLE